MQRATMLVLTGLLLGACEPSRSASRATPDAGDASASSPDAMTSALDAGRDASSAMRDAATDAALSDAGTSAPCKPFVMPADCLDAEGHVVAPPDGVLPTELRCTGLYGDWETRELACGVQEYVPAHQLWSDGAVKRRFVSLPPGKAIDATKPDAFVYPVGTQFWKEFNIQDGHGGTRIGETRILRKVDGGWLYTTYVWNDAGTRAIQDNDGVTDLFGFGHTVPTRDQCKQCHLGRDDFVLGWDRILLGPGATGVTLDRLVTEGRFTASAGAPTALSIPGSDVEHAALGYLHVNCGVSCHNRNLTADAVMSGLFLRLDADKLTSVHATDAVTTAINKVPGLNRPAQPADPASGSFYDIRPLDLERSLMLARVKLRGDGQMPLIGTNVVDPDGVAALTAFVNAMTVENGYPAPAP